MTEKQIKIILEDQLDVIHLHAMSINNSRKLKEEIPMIGKKTFFEIYLRSIVKANGFIDGFNVNNMLIELMNESIASQCKRLSGWTDELDETVEFYKELYHNAVELVKKYSREYAEEYAQPRRARK